MHVVRGKALHFAAYALVKMSNRGVAIEDVRRVIDEGNYHPSERLGRLWITFRTVIVYYEERESYYYVRNVGVTRRRF